jgi:hypothetical protein
MQCTVIGDVDDKWFKSGQLFAYLVNGIHDYVGLLREYLLEGAYLGTMKNALLDIRVGL